MPTQQASTKRVSHPDDGKCSQPVDELVSLLKADLPGSLVAVDKPSNPSGEWFIDVALGRFRAQISWQPQHGFGLFTAPHGYGDRPNEVFVSPLHAAARILQIHQQWEHAHEITPITLAQLRQLMGIHQTALADALMLNQPAVSRFEKREDVKMSTLSSYVEALGGRLDVRVNFDDLGISVDLYRGSGLK